jgi:hypothetical protein
LRSEVIVKTSQLSRFRRRKPKRLTCRRISREKEEEDLSKRAEELRLNRHCIAFPVDLSPPSDRAVESQLRDQSSFGVLLQAEETDSLEIYRALPTVDEEGNIRCCQIEMHSETKRLEEAKVLERLAEEEVNENEHALPQAGEGPVRGEIERCQRSIEPAGVTRKRKYPILERSRRRRIIPLAIVNCRGRSVSTVSLVYRRRERTPIVS